MSKGGKRKGAGRPKAKELRVRLSVRVHPETVPKLNKLGRAHGSRGKAIDQLVKSATKEKV